VRKVADLPHQTTGRSGYHRFTVRTEERRRNAPGTDASIHRGSSWLLVGLIICLTWIAYFPILGFGFTDVDAFTLIETGRVHGLDDLWDVLARPLMQGEMINANYYRPVTSLSYGLDELLWGNDSFGFHLTDLVLHCLNAVLVFGFVRRLWLSTGGEQGRPLLVATLAALLFALHPVNVEDVPAIARRAELLVTGFLLASGWCVLVADRSGSAWAKAGALLAAGLCMLSKETGFVAPAFAGVILFCVEEPRPIGARLLRTGVRLAPFALLAVASFLVRHRVLNTIGGYGDRSLADLLERPFDELRIHAFGLGLGGVSDLWPPIRRRLEPLRPFAAWLYVGGLVAFAALALRLLRAWRHATHEQQQRLRPSTLRGAVLAVPPVLLFGLHLAAPYAARYLYASTPFVAAGMAWGLVYGLPAASKQSAPRRALATRLAWGLLVVWAASLVFTGPLVWKRGLYKWERSAALGDGILSDIERLAMQEPAPDRLFLLNVPWWYDGSGVPMPDTLVLLEHSIRSWIELTHPDWDTDVIIPTYLMLMTAHEVVDSSVRVLPESEAGKMAASPAGSLILEATVPRSDGRVTPFPWERIRPDAFEGTVFRPLGAGFGERLLVEMREPPADGDVVLIYERGRLRRVDGSDFARIFRATPR
jgi:hypothetical protein